MLQTGTESPIGHIVRIQLAKIHILTEFKSRTQSKDHAKQATVWGYEDRFNVQTTDQAKRVTAQMLLYVQRTYTQQIFMICAA